MAKIATSVTIKPARIELCEYAERAFNEAAVFLRDGYSFEPGYPPEVLLTGIAIIRLVLTSPATAA